MDQSEPIEGDQIRVKPHHNKGKHFGRPFEKGHVVYPNTKPPRKHANLKSLLNDELLRSPTVKEEKFDGKGLSNAYWIIQSYVSQAREGDRSVIRDLLDRLEGRPAQVISGPGGGPIETRQEVKVLEAKDIASALGALVECGAIKVEKN